MSIFDYPFLLKSLVSTLWLSVVFALLGVFVFIKKMSFFSDGVAHASILGLAIAFLLNFNILVLALIAGALFAVLIFCLERKTKIHTDTLIGLIFVSALSLGLILMSLKSAYQPELLNFLIGNILTISYFDFILTNIFSLLVLLILFFNFKKTLLSLFDPVEAKLRKVNVNFYAILFYLILGTSVILGIKLVGVVLVTAFLIIPPSISSLIAKSFKQFVLFSVVFGFFSSLFGFLVADFYNFPVGATIVLVGSALFFVFFAYKTMLK